MQDTIATIRQQVVRFGGCFTTWENIFFISFPTPDRAKNFARWLKTSGLNPTPTAFFTIWTCLDGLIVRYATRSIDETGRIGYPYGSLKKEN